MNHEKMSGLISEMRKNQNMTQKQLAEKIGVTDKAVSKWERGAGCPDISTLPILADSLGISVGDLLNGEISGDTPPETEKIVKETLRYADDASRRKVVMSRKISFIVITITALLGVTVCTICNVAVNGAFTWSMYPIIAIAFGWAIITPAVVFHRRGILVSMIVVTIILIPFLTAIGTLSGYHQAMNSIGIKIAVVSLIYMWIVYLIDRRLGHKKRTAAGICVLLAIPVTIAINRIVDTYVQQSRIDVWDILTYAILAFIALIFFKWGETNGTGE